ncbi:MAG: SOS response-associated peptidase [Syntrophales bacterium]|nr:SOS response-associated peptidase [Syntrophales bacterium]
MCGRYVLLSDLSQIEKSFGLSSLPSSFSRGNNISPGEKVLALCEVGNRREAGVFRWGLIPAWMKEVPKNGGFINARAETLASKVSFRDAFRSRRCLIIADGFYEWQKVEGKRKQPWFFYLRSGEPFAFAGLYESWKPPQGESVNTCTIITTQANEIVAPVHDRMPVILPPDVYDSWLDPANRDIRNLTDLLRPYPASEMASRAEFPILRII